MRHYQCPICGQEQAFQDDRAYGFCQRCGTKLILNQTVLPPAEEPAWNKPGHSEADMSGRQELPKAESLASLPLKEERTPSAASAPHSGADFAVPEDMDEAAQEREDKRSTAKAWLVGTAAAVALLAAVACAVIFWIKPAADYNLNMTRHNSGQYAEAIEGFKNLGDFRDSRHMADVCRLDKALWELGNGKLSDSAQSLASIEDPELDTSTYNAMAEALVKKSLMGELNYDKALTDLALLPKGRAGDVDSSFLYAFGQTLADKDYGRAAWALDAFTPYISGRAQAETMVLEEMVSLMDDGRYQDASDLNHHFAALLENPEGDVIARFREFLETEEFFRAAALLEVFKEKIGDQESLEIELEENLDALLKAEKDEKAIELCYAFEAFKDMNPFLQEKTSALLAENAEKENWGRLNAILDHFVPYNEKLAEEVETIFTECLEQQSFEEAEGLLKELDSPLFDKQAWEYDLAKALWEAKELDKAEAHFKALGNYKDSQEIVTEILYQQILKLWDEGKNEEAEELIKNLGSTQMADEITKEAKLRSVLKLMEKELMEPEEFTKAYTTLYGIRTHDGAADKLVELLEKWADVVIQEKDRKAYLSAMTGMGFISSKNRSHICQYVIKKTEALAGRKKDGSAWTMERKWLPYNVYRFLEQVSDDTGVTRSFITFAMSMDKKEVKIDVTDIWYLWDVREDIRELSASNEYLILFLSGVWKTKDGKAVLEVSKKNNEHTVSYNVPPTKQEGKITASLFGLTGPKGRLCDIKIIDYNTIELTNVADGKTYKMTRP